MQASNANFNFPVIVLQCISSLIFYVNLDSAPIDNSILITDKIYTQYKHVLLLERTTTKKNCQRSAYSKYN